MNDCTRTEVTKRSHESISRGHLVGARIRITGNDEPGDALRFTITPTIRGHFAHVTGTLTLTGVDTASRYQAALRGVSFLNGSDTPGDRPRTISLLVNDGQINSNVVSRTINVIPTNDVPLLSAADIPPFEYTEAGTPINVAAGITIIDGDRVLSSARIKIATNYQSGADLLSFVNTATIAGVFDAVSGTLVLSGIDTVANYRAALDSVRYRNVSTTPSTLQRGVLILVNDGVVNSNIISRRINVTAIP